MHTSDELHPLQESAQRDSTISARYFFASAIGALLCITGTATQEEILAYAGFGKFFVLGGIAFAYRVGADDKIREHRRISVR